MIVRWNSVQVGTRKLTFVTKFGRCRGEPTTGSYELAAISVESALFRCSSDLIRLKLFLWCGRQPNYYHQHHLFCCMVPVIERLTQKYQSVRGIIGELESYGFHTKAQTFMTLLRIYWCGGIHGSAVETFVEMSNFGYTPNTFARNMVIDVLFKLKQGDTALRIFKETPSPNFLSYNIVISNLCELSDWPTVCQTVKEMMRKGFVPDDRFFMGMLNCSCKSHRVREMFQVLGLMISLGYQLTVAAWSILIDEFCRIGKVCLALEFLKKMRNSGVCPNVVTYTTLIKGCFRKNMPVEVSNLLKNVEDEGLFYDLVISNTLIDCLAKSGRYDEATRVFCSLPGRNLRPDFYTYTSMLPVLSSSGNLSSLSDRLNSTDVFFDNVLYNSLLNFYCKTGHPQRAVELFHRLMAAGYTPDCYSFAGLLESLFKLRKITKAVDVYCSIIGDKLQADAYIHTIVLHGLIRASRFDLFLQFSNRAVDENYDLDVVSYTVIIHGLIESGRFEEAWILFDKMKELGLCPSTFTCNVILRCLCKRKDKGGIQQLLEFMSRENVDLDSFSYSILIVYLCKTCTSQSALRIYMEMRKLNLKPTKAAFSLLVETLFRSGAIDDASRLLKEHLEFKVIICSESLGKHSILDVAYPGNSMALKDEVGIM